MTSTDQEYGVESVGIVFVRVSECHFNRIQAQNYQNVEYHAHCIQKIIGADADDSNGELYDTLTLVICA